jgi:hypothetical protein
VSSPVPFTDLPPLILLIQHAERLRAEGLDLRPKWARDGYFLRLWIAEQYDARSVRAFARQHGFAVTLMARHPNGAGHHGWQLCIIIPTAAVDAAKPYGHLTGYQDDPAAVARLSAPPSPRELNP